MSKDFNLLDEHFKKTIEKEHARAHKNCLLKPEGDPFQDEYGIVTHKAYMEWAFGKSFEQRQNFNNTVAEHIKKKVSNNPSLAGILYDNSDSTAHNWNPSGTITQDELLDSYQAIRMGVPGANTDEEIAMRNLSLYSQSFQPRRGWSFGQQPRYDPVLGFQGREKLWDKLKEEAVQNSENTPFINVGENAPDSNGNFHPLEPRRLNTQNGSQLNFQSVNSGFNNDRVFIPPEYNKIPDSVKNAKIPRTFQQHFEEMSQDKTKTFRK